MILGCKLHCSGVRGQKQAISWRLDLSIHFFCNLSKVNGSLWNYTKRCHMSIGMLEWFLGLWLIENLQGIRVQKGTTCTSICVQFFLLKEEPKIWALSLLAQTIQYLTSSVYLLSCAQQSLLLICIFKTIIDRRKLSVNKMMLKKIHWWVSVHENDKSYVFLDEIIGFVMSPYEVTKWVLNTHSNHTKWLSWLWMLSTVEILDQKQIENEMRKHYFRILFFSWVIQTFEDL